MNHKRRISNLLVPKGKGQVVALWRMSALVLGLSALVLVTFAAPSGVAAADITFLAADSKLAGTHCPDAAVGALNANHGTLSSCWSEIMADNPELMAASRYVASAVSSAVPATDAALLADNPE
jgi:hypothetical protein